MTRARSARTGDCRQGLFTWEAALPRGIALSRQAVGPSVEDFSQVPEASVFINALVNTQPSPVLLFRSRSTSGSSWGLGAEGQR